MGEKDKNVRKIRKVGGKVKIVPSIIQKFIFFFWGGGQKQLGPLSAKIVCSPVPQHPPPNLISEFAPARGYELLSHVNSHNTLLRFPLFNSFCC